MGTPNSVPKIKYIYSWPLYHRMGEGWMANGIDQVSDDWEIYNGS